MVKSDEGGSVAGVAESDVSGAAVRSRMGGSVSGDRTRRMCRTGCGWSSGQERAGWKCGRRRDVTENANFGIWKFGCLIFFCGWNLNTMPSQNAL